MSRESKQQRLLSKLHLVKTQVDECITILVAGVKAKSSSEKRISSRRQKRAPVPSVTHTKLDFDQPMIAFIKKHAQQMSGPKKFTLVLARLTKGDLKQEVSLQEIEKQWNRMTAKTLLGMGFNRFYAAQARQEDWVELKERGLYGLRLSWRGILI